MSLQTVFGNSAGYGYGVSDVDAAMRGILSFAHPSTTPHVGKIVADAFSNSINPTGGLFSRLSGQSQKPTHVSTDQTAAGPSVSANAVNIDHANGGHAAAVERTAEVKSNIEGVQNDVRAGLEQAADGIPDVSQAQVNGSFIPNRSNETVNAGLAVMGGAAGVVGGAAAKAATAVSTASNVGDAIELAKAVAGVNSLPPKLEARVAAVAVSNMLPSVDPATGLSQDPVIQTDMSQDALMQLQNQLLSGDPAQMADATRQVKEILIPVEEQEEFRAVLAAEMELERDVANHASVEAETNEIIATVGMSGASNLTTGDIMQVREADAAGVALDDMDAQAFWDEMKLNSGGVSAFAAQIAGDFSAITVTNDNLAIATAHIDSVDEAMAALSQDASSDTPDIVMGREDELARLAQSAMNIGGMSAA